MVGVEMKERWGKDKKLRIIGDGEKQRSGGVYGQRGDMYGPEGWHASGRLTLAFLLNFPWLFSRKIRVQKNTHHQGSTGDVKHHTRTFPTPNPPPHLI
jgi:hypothetical protein